MNVILTCGGTAGHVNPAIAVAQRLRSMDPNCEILFLGAEGKMEMDLVPRDGFEIRPLRVSNLSRGHHIADISHNVEALKNVFEAEREAGRILKEFAPDAVLGTGGYVCYPVLHKAAKMGIPTLIHESNAVPGLTTKMLAGHVNCVLLGYEESRQYYDKAQDLRTTGTPVRGKFGQYTKAKAKSELGLPENLPLVVSMWGSLGSEYMNEVFLKMFPLLRGQSEFCMIHATGKYYHQKVEERVQALGIRPQDCHTEIREYIFDAERVLSAADLVLCRAGASTLSELISIGKPALIVPSPNVTNHHQERNARLIERAGGARVLLEGQFDEQSFLEEIRDLLHDRIKLEEMSRSMHALAVPDALDQIVNALLEYAGKKA